MFKQWLSPSISGLVVSGLTVTIPMVSYAQSSLTQLFPVLQGISLTPQQTTQIEALRDQMLPQLFQLLTPTQKTQLQAELATGKGLRASVLSLNPSMPQRLKMMPLLQGMQSQVNQILTPAQQQQARQNLRTLQQQGR
jgi:hypothetical protein